MTEVVVRELVAEHEGELFVEEVVLARDLAAVGVLGRIEEAGRRSLSE